MFHFSLHPGTRLFLVMPFILLIFKLPLEYQALTLLAGGILAFGLARPLPSGDPGGTFFRLLLIAGLFLLIIHCVSYDGTLVFNPSGLRVAGTIFFRIGSLMVAFLWIIRTMESDELFAMLIDLHLPVPIIYVILQVVYLVPRFGDRAREIFTAQQARGFVLRGIHNRIQAFILILAPLFATMMYELEESAASISARGLYATGRKSHVTEIKFTYLDAALLFISFIVITMAFLRL